jgi:hypothetical protein
MLRAAKRARERRQAKGRPGARAQFPFEPATAIHEAGHCVYGCRAGLDVVRVEVSADARGVCWSRRGIEKPLAQIMAGFAAEQLLIGRTVQGSTDDLAAALERIRGRRDPAPPTEAEWATLEAANRQAREGLQPHLEVVQAVARHLARFGVLEGATLRTLTAGLPPLDTDQQ